MPPPQRSANRRESPGNFTDKWPRGEKARYRLPYLLVALRRNRQSSPCPPYPLNMHPRLVQAIDQFDEYISATGGLMGEKCAAP